MLKLEEKMKHRIVGIAVLLSIMLVIFPAMVKKSNQQLNNNMEYAVNMPAKPDFPAVDATKAKTLFNAVKEARVELPTVVKNPNAVTVAKAEPLSEHVVTYSILQKTPVLGKQTKPVFTKTVEPTLVAKNKPAAKPVTPTVAVKKPVFSVQIASFNSKSNAETLVQSLNQKGFKATYDKQGAMFRVLVGQVDQLEQAKLLQEQLSSSTRMSGFIIKVG